MVEFADMDKQGAKQVYVEVVDAVEEGEKNAK